MNRLFCSLKKKYLLGYKWSMTESYEEELLTQVYYIQAIIVGLAIVSKLVSAGFGLYLIFILAHLVSMCVFGFLKALWEGDKKEKIYRNAYKVINFLLAVLSLFVLKSVYYILIIAFATALGVILSVAPEFIEDVCSKRMKKQTTMAITNAFACVFAIVGIFVIEMPIILKIVLAVVYVLCIPIITIAADDGMNFLEPLSYTVYVDVDEDFLKQIRNNKEK